MKQLIICVFAAHYVSSAEAQITRKHWLLGGTIDYQHNKHANAPDVIAKSKIFNLSGRVGYFFMDRLAAGIIPQFQVGTHIASGGTGYHKDLRLGPFARYYFLSTDSRLNLLLEGFYLRGYERGESGGPVSRARIRTIGVQGGPAFFVNSVVGLELLLGYSSTRSTGEDRIFHNKTYVALGIQVHLERDKNSP